MENSTPRSRPLKVSEPHLVAPKARRQSNTQFRLKALSASGVGSQGAPSEKPEDLSLLLDNLDKNV
jgi:hypothetical protein